MATNPQNSVMNDAQVYENNTNTDQKQFYTAFEVECMRDGNEARINSLTRGYERKITDLKTEYAAQIQQVQMEKAEAVTKANKERKGAIDAAVRDSVYEKNRAEVELQGAIEKSNTDKDAAVQKLETCEDDLRKLKESHAMEKAKFERRIENLSKSHTKEVAELRKKVAVRVHFRSSQRKRKVRWAQAGTRFDEASLEFRKSTPGKDSFTFTHKDVVIKDWTKTLGQIGVKDGDEIWYQ